MFILTLLLKRVFFFAQPTYSLQLADVAAAHFSPLKHYYLSGSATEIDDFQTPPLRLSKYPLEYALYVSKTVKTHFSKESFLSCKQYFAESAKKSSREKKTERAEEKAELNMLSSFTPFSC